MKMDDLREDTSSNLLCKNGEGIIITPEEGEEIGEVKYWKCSENER